LQTRRKTTENVADNTFAFWENGEGLEMQFFMERKGKRKKGLLRKKWGYNF